MTSRTQVVRADSAKEWSRRSVLSGGAIAAAAAATPLLTAACQPQAPSGGGNAPNSDADTINYMVTAGSPFSQVVQEMIEPIFTTQTGIKVNIVELPYEQSYPKAILEARNRSGVYDVIQLNRPTLTAFVEPGYLLPLDDYVDADIVADLMPVHREYMTYDGDIFALPHSNDVRCLYYRTDLFEEAGLAHPPTNWDEWTAAALELTTDNRYGLLLAGSSKDAGIWTLTDFMHQNGATVLDENGDVVVDSPESVEALEYFAALLNDYKVLPPGTSNYIWADTRTLFPQGDFGMVVEFNDIIPNLEDTSQSVISGKYDIALIPGNPTSATSNAGWLVGIPDGSQKAEAAGQLINFILSTEAQMKMCQETGTLSGRSSVLDQLAAEGDDSLPKTSAASSARWEFYKTVSEHTYELPRAANEQAIETVLGQALSSVLAQNESATDALSRAADDIQQL